MSKVALLSSILLLTLHWLSAQSTSPTPGIYVNGILTNGQVRLRWVPADFGAFLQGKQYGYQITRELFSINGTPIPNEERQQSAVQFGPFLPLAETAWDPISDTSDIAGVAQGALYAENFEVSPGNDAFYEATNADQQNQDRFGFGLFAADQSFQIARYMGLGMIDSTAIAEPDGDYLYKVVILSPDPAQRPRGLGLVSINQNFALPAPQGLTITTSPGQALLTIPRGTLEEHYTSFNIERSADGGATWVKRNSNPLLFTSNDAESESMLFSDSIEMPEVPYKYRITGNSPFGIVGSPSNEVMAEAPRAVLGILPNLQTIAEVNGNFQLTWDFPADKNNEIVKFEIYRSTTAEGGFTLISDTDVSTRVYTDPSPDPLVNFYKVVAVDLGNNPNESTVKMGQLNDMTPPSTPTGLEAEVNDDGLVTLSWNGNTETDLKGYRVYFSNNPDGDFAQITGEVLESTTFKHQLELKVLGKKVYYKILATDFRENDSEYTSPVSINRPDVIPPAQPILSKVEPLPLGVQLTWVNSSSEDMQRHEVQRKLAKSMAWQSLSTFLAGTNITEFMDSTTTGTQEFSYRVLAFDSSGLASSSTVINVKPTRTNIDTIVGLKAASAVEGTQKQAKLSWQYPGLEPVLEFHIYRSPIGMEPHMYATLKVVADELVIDPASLRATFHFRDKDIDPLTEYQYRVLAKFGDGSSSPLTKIVKFKY